MTQCDDFNFDMSIRRCQDTEVVDPISALARPRILMNGFALTMASTPLWSRDNCMWLTMFRDPVARLVSALFFCRRFSFDPLCGDKSGQWFKETTVAEMAQYWGPYLMREMLLHPRLTPMIGSRTRNQWRDNQRVWQRWRDELRGGDNMETLAGKQNLQSVLAALPELFDVFGVIEEFDLSMSLFDCVVPLHDSSWKTATSNNRESEGSSEFKNEEDAALEYARKDPTVLKALSADIAIYDRALKLFREHAEHVRNQTAACAPSSRSSLLSGARQGRKRRAKK
jgi:hypothetical protein